MAGQRGFVRGVVADPNPQTVDVTIRDEYGALSLEVL